LTHGYITQAQYTVLVTVVILSAVLPTVIAERFFRPDLRSEQASGMAGGVPEAKNLESEA